jgi:hypothetical protein
MMASSAAQAALLSLANRLLDIAVMYRKTAKGCGSYFSGTLDGARITLVKYGGNRNVVVGLTAFTTLRGPQRELG